MNAYEVLKERGFIEQLTDVKKNKALIEKGGDTYNIAIDPPRTACTLGIS